MNYKDDKENTISTAEDNTEIPTENSGVSDNEPSDIEQNDNDTPKTKFTDKGTKKKKRRIFSSRKFKKGIFAAVFTCLVVVLVVVVNIIVNVLQTKIPSLSFDMTGQNLYMLSDSSKEIIKDINQDITISVLSREDTYTQADENFLKANVLLKKYAAENNKIKIEYIDLQSNPTYPTKYPNEKITAFSYIVSCGDKYKYLSATEDLFTISRDYSTGSTRVESSNVESAVTSAIRFVTSKTQTKITVLHGFSEQQNAGLEQLVSLLKASNYLVEDIDLLSNSIPSDSSMVILYQPVSDLTKDSAKKIDDYLNSGDGKNLFFVPISQKVNTPNINSILEEWDISIGQGIVAETDNSYILNTKNYYFSRLDYGNNKYTEKIKNPGKSLMGALARPVIIENTSRVTSIATTSKNAAMCGWDANKDWDPTQHIEGSFNIGAVSTKSGNNKSSTVTVWGSGMSFYPQWLTSSTYLNGEYFKSLFGILTDKHDDNITIESKSVQTSQLGIMADQVNPLRIVFVYIIPAIVLITGLIIWIRRRHR